MQMWTEKIKERLQKAQFVDGNPDEPNLDAKFLPETDERGAYVVLGDHPCGEDDVNAVIEVHSSPDNNGIARWITSAYNADNAKLIQAVEVAEKALLHVALASEDRMGDRFCHMCNKATASDHHRKVCKVGIALAQLQTGEFPLSDDR